MTLRHACIAAFFAWPLSAQAGGFAVAQQAATAGGTGHASTARDDDASAAWFNPAALTDNQGLRLAAGISAAAVRIRAQAQPQSPDAPWQSQTDPLLSTPPHLYASFAKEQWAVGLSANVAFGSRIRWPADWEYRFDILESRPQFFRIAPFFAWQFGGVSLAIGPHIDMGSLYIHKATNHISEEGSAELLLNGWGVGLHLGVLVRVTPELNVGFRATTRTSVRLKGNADFDVPLPFASKYPDQNVQAPWTLPDQFVVGVAWSLDQWTLMADLGLTLWSVNQQLAFDFEDEATDDLTQLNEWRSSASLRAGAEWSPLNRWIVRGGAYADGLPGAPPPTHTLAPSSPDSTRIGFTTGLGFEPTSQIGVDLFYEHMQLLPRASESPDAPIASYRGSAHIVGLTVQFNLAPDTSKAKPVPPPSAASERDPETDPPESESPWQTPSPSDGE